MNTTRASHPIPIALTALVAFFSALAALAVSNGHDAHAHGNAPHQATPPVTVAHSSATGAAAGGQLTAPLRDRILIAADLIAAARKGDQAGVASEQARRRFR